MAHRNLAHGGPLNGHLIEFPRVPRDGEQYKASNDNYYKFHTTSGQWLFCATAYSPARLNAPR